MTDLSAEASAHDDDRITLRGVMIVLCSTVGTATYAVTWNSVGVALPHMQGAFSATTDQIAWVMIAFVIGSSMMTASVGWFSMRFGRRQMFLLTITGYTLTLVGCGFSTSLLEEVAWRFLQGLCGAGLIPLGQAIAVNAFPPGRYGQATSLWAMGFVTANVFAPTLAGLLIDNFGWPWIFFVNVPIAAIVLATAWLLVPETPKSSERLDWIGFTSLIICVGTVQLMLARGERQDWFESTEIAIEALITVSAFYVFVVHTMSSRQPFVNRSLFRERNFVLGEVFIFMVGAVLFLPLLLLPLQLQQISGYAAIDTGNLLMARGVGSVLGLLVVSQIRDRMDPRHLLTIGLAFTALASWMMSDWTVDIRARDVILSNFILGCATGAIWAPLSALALANLDKRVQDQGFAMFYLSFDMGYSIGTAVIIGLHARHSQINHALMNEFITPFNRLLTKPFEKDAWDITERSGLASLDLEVVRQSTMIAYNNSFMLIAFLLVALIPFIILFRVQPNPSPSTVKN